jgi:hypothetical protein
MVGSSTPPPCVTRKTLSPAPNQATGPDRLHVTRPTRCTLHAFAPFGPAAFVTSGRYGYIFGCWDSSSIARGFPDLPATVGEVCRRRCAWHLKSRRSHGSARRFSGVGDEWTIRMRHATSTPKAPLRHECVQRCRGGQLLSWTLPAAIS